MLRVSLLALAAGSASAFAPAALSLRARNSPAVSGICMQSSKPIDRKDGFGGGADAVIKSLEDRSKNSWEGASTGGASGKISKQATSFEDYLKERAAKADGVVTDAAGNDISKAKPTYKVQEGAWGAPEGTTYDADPLDFMDKSVSGFEKQDTAWLDDDTVKAAKAEKAAENANKQSEIDAKMAMWMKQAEDKKNAA